MVKKFLVVFVLVVFGLASSITYAAPVGNIAKPAMLKSAMISKEVGDAQFGIIAEGEVDIIFDDDDGDADGESRFYSSKIDLVIADRFMPYVLLGAGYHEMEFTDEGSKVEIKTKTDFVWGLGATLILYETAIAEFYDSILRFGVDGRYRSTDIEVDKVIIDGTEYSLPSGSVTSMEFDLSEWQIAGAVSLQIQRFVPYFGVKYSDYDVTARSTISGTTYSEDGSASDDQVGIFVGADILVADSISINVEGRFIDETAMTLGGAIRF